MNVGPDVAEIVRRAEGRRGSTEGRGRAGCEARREHDASVCLGRMDDGAAVVAVVEEDVVVVVVEVIGESCGLNNWLRTAAAPSVPPREAGAIGAGCAGPG